MSISFDDDMGSEISTRLQRMFDVKAIDKRVALLNNVQQALDQTKMKELANAAKQPVTVEVNSIGDRKEVGGVVYELNDKGWQRLPIGTGL